MAKIKSENAWLRKSRCTELPGPLPTTLLVATAIRAWAIWASLSISNLAAGTSVSSVNFSIRARHVSKRCRNGKSLFLVSTRNATPMIATPAKAPANINSFFIATRPMNIIRKTTPKSKAAVERFSGAISRQTTPVIIMIRLKAFGLAPSSSCPLERIKAVTMITAIFATSEGWNWIPMKVIQRAAPLMRSIIITRPSNTTDKGSRNTGNT